MMHLGFFGPWMEFRRGVTQFCLISRGESLFSLEFLKAKSHKSKISRGILQNYILNCLFLFFWNSPFK